MPKKSCYDYDYDYDNLVPRGRGPLDRTKKSIPLEIWSRANISYRATLYKRMWVSRKREIARSVP